MASVRVARAEQIEAERPQLAFRIADADNAATCELLIENVGRGIAIFVGFLITSGSGRASEGYTHAPSNLWPTKLARIELPFRTVEGAQGVVWCADRRGNVHAWNDGHGFRYYPKSRVSAGGHTAKQTFRDLYPDSDVGSLTFLAPTTKPLDD